MAANFKTASDDVIETAQYLIDKYHPHLRYARIGFLFRSEAPVSGGKVTLGRAKLVTAEMKVYANYDFLIWLAKDYYGSMNNEQRTALIDHELCHCWYDEDEGKASMRGHDLEEFNVILQRYGFWWKGAEVTAQAVQGHLFPVVLERGVVEAVAVPSSTDHLDDVNG